MSPIDLVGHLANLIYCVGFIIKNILWLRLVMIVAAIVEIIYLYNFPDGPVWVYIYWCILWIAVNFVQLTILLREKITLKFSPEEYRLYQLTFSSIPEILYKKLISVAKWGDTDPESILVDEGVEFDKLLLIYSGIAEVESQNELVAYLRDGNFVGEMSFISGNLTSARVRALSEIKYVYWDKSTLTKILNKSKELDDGLRTVFNIDLVKKLTKKK